MIKPHICLNWGIQRSPYQFIAKIYLKRFSTAFFEMIHKDFTFKSLENHRQISAETKNESKVTTSSHTSYHLYLIISAMHQKPHFLIKIYANCVNSIPRHVLR